MRYSDDGPDRHTPTTQPIANYQSKDGRCAKSFVLTPVCDNAVGGIFRAVTAITDGPGSMDEEEHDLATSESLDSFSDFSDEMTAYDDALGYFPSPKPKISLSNLR